jgi:hypothetical protein
MPDNQETQNLGRYLEDIATIKDMLFKAEQKPLYENWAFYAWGSLIMAASILHFLVERVRLLPVRQLFLEIWLPTLLVAGFIEAISLIRNLSRQALPLFSRTVLRFYLSVLGSAGVFVLIVVMAIKLQAISLLPLLLLLTAAVFYFIFAQTTYTHMYIHGYLFLILAVILYLFHIPHQVLVPLVGCTIGVSLIITGLTEYFLHRRSP